MHPGEPTPESAHADTPRSRELFAQYRNDIHVRTDRLFAGLMVFQWLLGIVFALWVSPRAWYGPVSVTHLHVWAALLVGGVISLFPALLGRLPAWPAVHPLHHRRRPDADGRAADSPDRRTDRDPLSRLWLARLPRVLSRLASADPCHGGRGCGSPAAWNLLAAVRVWRGRRQPVAVAGARGLGHLRRHRARRRVPPQHLGNAADRRANGGARAGDSHAATGRTGTGAPGARSAAGARRRAAERRAIRGAGRSTADHAAAGRGGDARQERVPGQHEPRAPDAAERHHSLQRAPAGGSRRPRQPRARFRTFSGSSLQESTCSI